MFKITVLNKIAPIGWDNLDREKYEISNDLENPDAILVRSANLLDMEFPDSLKAIARAGAASTTYRLIVVRNGELLFSTPPAPMPMR